MRRFRRLFQLEEGALIEFLTSYENQIAVMPATAGIQTEPRQALIVTVSARCPV